MAALISFVRGNAGARARLAAAGLLSVLLAGILLSVRIIAGTLTTITPGGASVLVPVSITGTGMHATAASNEVIFAHPDGTTRTSPGMAVTALDSTRKRLTTRVPEGLPVGRVSLTVRNTVTGETSSGVSLDVIGISLPEVSNAVRGSSGVKVRINGSANVVFVSGQTSASFGAGVTVRSVTVESPTSLVAVVDVAASAAEGLRAVQTRTSTQTGLLDGAFGVLAAPPPNQAPVANAGGPYTGLTGQQLQFDGTGSSDPDKDPLSYAWDFGDGSKGSGPTPSHTYQSAGPFTVSLTVTDGRGGSHTATTTATIALPNANPTANPGGPYKGIAGSAVAFDGTGSSDPDKDSLVYAWDFGDGNKGTGATPSHTYATAGAFTVSLTVSDGRGGTDSASTSADIAEPPPQNRPPVANAGGPYTGVQAIAVVFDATRSTDPDGDALTFAWQFGDGNSGTGAAPSHSYAAPGEFTVTLRVTDSRGGSSEATATVVISEPAPQGQGRGVVSGEVYDDATGLPLVSATVTLVRDGSGDLATAPQTTVDARGRYTLPAQEGSVLVRIGRDGFTEVERQAVVPRDQGAIVVDARLTPIDAKANQITTAFGGSATSAAGSPSLKIAAGAMTHDVVLRMTAVSGQGLQGLLPHGWSPVAAADISPHGVPLGQRGELVLRNDAGIPRARTLVAAYFDAEAHLWRAAGTPRLSDDGRSIGLDVDRTAQWVVVAPDAAPFTPAQPQDGQPLPAAAEQSLPSNLSAEGLVTPRSAPPGPTARAQGTVTIQAQEAMPSGTRIAGYTSERFELYDGAVLVPSPFTQDFVLYTDPRTGQPMTLLARLPITASRTFTLQELALGRVTIDVVRPGPVAGGAIVGAGGGSATDGEGTTIFVDPGSVPDGTFVQVLSLPAARVAATIPPGFELVYAFELETSAPLNASGRIVRTAPAGASAGDQFVIARIVRDESGVPWLKLVAVAVVQSGQLLSRTDVNGLTLPGVTEPGTYALLKASTPFGFVGGIVRAVGGAGAQPAALVTSNTAPFADITDQTGRYLIAAGVGVDTQVTAVDRLRNTAQGVIQVPAAGAAAALDLTLGVTAPTVVSTTPVSNATRVPLDTLLSIRFSASMAESTISATSVLLRHGASPVAVSRTLSADGKTLTIRPDAPLLSNTPYVLDLSSAIQDVHGHALATPPPLSFTTADTSKPVALPAGQLVALLPDDDGIVMVTGSPGTAEGGTFVTAANLRTQETFTAIALADGSFRLRLTAVLVDQIAVTFRNSAGQEIVHNITHYSNPDGTVALGEAGGTIGGPGGRSGRILAGALQSGGTFRLDVPAAPTVPALPPDLSIVDQFTLTIDRAVFKPLRSLTLTESQGRFAPATATAAPFEAGGSLIVPADFLANGTLKFRGTVVDAAGNQRAVDGTTLVVPSNPAGGAATVSSGERFPRVHLTTPNQAVVNQQVDIHAIAPTSRVDFSLPIPAGLPASTSVLLARPIEIGGVTRLAVVDRFDRTSTHLESIGHALSGVAAGGSYVVVASTTPLAFATGRLTGPALTVAVDGSPFVYETTGPNAAFVVPVAAGLPFTLQFVDPATGVIKGSSSGQAPESGVVDMGEPLGAAAGQLRVSGQPNSNWIVDADAPIVLSFSEPVDLATINATNIVVTDAGGLRVFGVFTASQDALRVTFTPLRRWRFATTFTYAVSTRVRAVSGARPDRPITGQFTTFSPRVVTTAAVDDVADVAVAGGTALVAGAAGLSVVDVTAAETPVVRHQLVEFGGAHGVALRAGANFTDRTGQSVSGLIGAAAVGGAPGAGHLRVLNLNDPESPVVIGSSQLSSQAGETPPTGVNPAGTPGMLDLDPAMRALIAISGVGLQAVDVTKAVPADPGSPGGASVGRYPTAVQESVSGVARLGSRLLVSGAGGLTLLDAAALTRLGSISTIGHSAAVAGTAAFPFDLNGDGAITAATETIDLALVANGSDGTLQFFNVTTPASPVLVSVVRFKQPVTSVAINADERLAYVGAGSDGLAIVDLAGPASVQPIDLDLNAIDDRILGMVNTPGLAGRLALDLSRGLALVADGPSGLTIVQLVPPRTRFSELLRDPVKAATGDEQSILETRVAYVSDDALKVTLTASIPPQTSLFLNIQEAPVGGGALLSFADGSTSAKLVNGANELEVKVAKPSTTTSSAVTLRIQDGVGGQLDVLTVRFATPDLDSITLASMFVAPAVTVLDEATPTGQLSTGGVFTNGEVLNLTSPESGTTYQVDRTEIADVSLEGVITGKAGGSTAIVASNREIVGYATAVVGLAPQITELTVRPQFISLPSVGSTVALRVTATYSDGTEVSVTDHPAITYSISEPGVIQVVQGVITGLALGQSVVRAQLGSTSVAANVVVANRPTTQITGISMPAVSPITVSTVDATVTATVSGSGALDGQEVTFRLTGVSVSALESKTLTDVFGAGSTLITGWTAPTTGALTVSVMDPQSGQTFSATQEVIVLASGDVEDPNPQAPLPTMEPDELIVGNLGGADMLDGFSIQVHESGVLLVRFEALNSPADSVTLTLRSAGGGVQQRQTSMASETFEFAVTAGTYTIEVQSAATSLDYRLSHSLRADPPHVLSVLPAAGPAGTQVRIQGTGFTTDPRRVTVLFGNIAAELLAATPTELVVVVPADAVTGPIQVVIGGAETFGPVFNTGIAGPAPLPAVSDADLLGMTTASGSDVVTSFRRLLVQFRPSVSQNAVAAIAASFGGRVIGRLPKRNGYQLEFSTRNLYELAMVRQQLAVRSEVVATGAETLVTFDAADNESLRLCNGAHECRWPMDLIGLFDAYRLMAPLRGSLAPVHVAVFDSGLQLSELAVRREFDGVDLKMWDFTTPTVTELTNKERAHFRDVGLDLTNAEGDPKTNPHGTYVSTLMMARNNGRLISGVFSGAYGDQPPTPGTSLTVVKFGEATAKGDLALAGVFMTSTKLASTTETIEQKPELNAAMRSVHVANMSWGGCLDPINRQYLEAFFARFSLTLFIVSAGNKNRNVQQPCFDARGTTAADINARSAPQLPATLTGQFANVMSVAGVAPTTKYRASGGVVREHEKLDQRAQFRIANEYSNFGALTPLNSPAWGGGIDLAAPGLTQTLSSRGLLRPFAGTSAAAPIVSGVASLLVALGGATPGACVTPACLKQILKETADDISGAWRRDVGNSGDARMKEWDGSMRRLNALAAVSRFVKPAPQTSVLIVDPARDDPAGTLLSFPVQPMKPFRFGGTSDTTPLDRQEKVLRDGAASTQTLAIAGPIVESSDGTRAYLAAAPEWFAPEDESQAVLKVYNIDFQIIESVIGLQTNETPTDLVASADGLYLFVSTPHKIVVVDLVEGKPMTTRPVFLENGDLDSSSERSFRTPELQGGLTYGRLSLSKDGKRLYAILNSGDGAGVQEGLVRIYNAETSKDARPDVTGVQPDLSQLMFPVPNAFSLAGGDRPIAVGVAEVTPTVGDVSERLYLVHGGLNRVTSVTGDASGLISAIQQDLIGGPTPSAGDTFNILQQWQQVLRDSEVVIGATGMVGVFDQKGRSNAAFPSGLTAAWRQTSPSLIPGPGRTSPDHMFMLPSSMVYAKRPFDITVHPSGKRAILPFFYTGNFGVLDLAAQELGGIWWRNSNDWLSGVAAVTPSLRLDQYGWPVKAGHPATAGIDHDGEAQLYPTRVRYSQNGRFAVAVHSGTFSTGDQRGAVTLIDDAAISDDLYAKADDFAAFGWPYFSVRPLDEQAANDRSLSKITAPIFGWKTGGATKLFESPRGVAIQPIVSFISPGSGRVIWTTASIHVQWHLPRSVASKIELFVEVAGQSRKVEGDLAATENASGFKRTFAQVVGPERLATMDCLRTDGCDAVITAILRDSAGEEVARARTFVRVRDGG